MSNFLYPRTVRIFLGIASEHLVLNWPSDYNIEYINRYKMRGREEDKETIENNSNFPLLSKNPDEDRENDGIYMKPKQLFTKNPLENTNIISKLFFSWVTPLTWYGKNNRLKPEDLNPPLKQLDPERLHDELLKNWNKYKDTSKNAIFKALVRTYWLPFLYAFIINFFQVLLEISIPFVLKEIIEFLQSSGENKKPIEYGIIFIGIYKLTIQFNIL